MCNNETFITQHIHILSLLFAKTCCPQFIYYTNSRAVTNPKKNSDPDPNPNEVSCRISNPDPIIHKNLNKT